MKPLPTSHLRIARPSHDLRASERFWVHGLGLDVLFRADDSASGGHALPEPARRYRSAAVATSPAQPSSSPISSMATSNEFR